MIETRIISASSSGDEHPARIDGFGQYVGNCGDISLLKIQPAKLTFSIRYGLLRLDEEQSPISEEANLR